MTADPRRGGDFGRNVTHHNPNQFWNSSGKHCWDQKMQGIGCAFDQITVTDLEGDNGMHCVAQHKDLSSTSPPTQKNGSAPHSPSTIAKCLETFVNKICEKLFQPLDRERRKEEIFPKAEVSELAKQLKDNTSRVLMESSDGNNIFKTTFPIPREHNDRTRIFEPQQTPEERRNAANKAVDMLHMCEFLFRRERFTDLLLILFTFNGIGRGGECKFLSHDTMFLDAFCCVLFAMWFQRKTLKTTPSGFAVECVHPVLCVFFALGCFWACDNGLFRPNGLGEVK